MNNKFTHLIQLDFAITTVVKQVEGFLELCKFEKKNQCTVTEIQLILEIYPQTPSTLVKSYFFGISYVYIFDVDFAINFDILLAKTRASYEEKG